MDPEGKAIVIESGTGKAALTVGAIVTPNTVLMVKGKKAAITDLTKEVKVGDMVSLKISRTTDLYAKEISKQIIHLSGSAKRNSLALTNKFQDHRLFLKSRRSGSKLCPALRGWTNWIE